MKISNSLCKYKSLYVVYYYILVTLRFLQKFLHSYSIVESFQNCLDALLNYTNAIDAYIFAEQSNASLSFCVSTLLNGNRDVHKKARTT
uniref:Uncharacterized protein n=1 Tax=Parascaris univalens TaxID=6257 RepID=A0A915B5Z4_PARUN